MNNQQEIDKILSDLYKMLKLNKLTISKNGMPRWENS